MIAVQLYNRSTNTAGYLNNLGQVIKDDAWENYWVTTDYIQVTPGSSCTYSGISLTYDKMFACFYDIDQHFISSFIPEKTKTDLTIPEGVYYVRFSLCKQTKVNLCSSILEVGSISETSGTPEAGNHFIRTQEYIDANNILTAELAPATTYTVSTTQDVFQIGLYYYRKAQDGGILYDSYYETPLDIPINKLTFTTITDTSFSGLKIRLYNPDLLPIEDVNIMLNMGEEALDYLPFSTEDRDDSRTFSFTIIAEAYQGFRKELYNYLKSTLSTNLTKGDMDVIIRLMCYIFGDLSGMVYHLKDQIDPDKAELAYLRHLGSVIGYTYNEALTADEQREALKIYLELQKKRGTNFSLKNLIAVFGQTRDSYYSSSDLRGVTITEGGMDDSGNDYKIGEEDTNGLYPGDIMIEIPAFSSILIDAIDNIRLIGTRILFTYAIYTTLNCQVSLDNWKELSIFFTPKYHYGNDYNPTIAQWISKINQAYSEGVIDGTNIKDISDWPILQGRVDNCHTELSCSIYTYHLEKIPEGFIWDETNKGKHKTFLLDNDTLVSDEVMYGYKGQPKKTE